MAFFIWSDAERQETEGGMEDVYKRQSLHRAKDALEHLKKAEAAGKDDTSLHALMGDAYRLLDRCV